MAVPQGYFDPLNEGSHLGDANDKRRSGFANAVRFGNPTPVVLAIDLNPDLHVYFSGQYPGLALTTASGNFVT